MIQFHQDDTERNGMQSENTNPENMQNAAPPQPQEPSAPQQSQSASAYGAPYGQPSGDGNPYMQDPQAGAYAYQGGQIPDHRFDVSGMSGIPFEKPKKKERKGMSRGVLAVVVVLCILLSGGAGFLGSRLAIQYTERGSSGGQTSLTGGTSVVYRAPESSGTVGGTESANIEVVVADAAASSVVEITTETVVTSSYYGQYVTSGAGSGVILTQDGYIITCAHVVSGASTVTVKLTTGDSYAATVVGSDSQTDIAVLKIDVTELPCAVLGNSDSLRVGETAVAIGNPLGSLGGTVTSGIISALDRQVQIDGQSYTLLQTSAAINPGNSGGGLFNSQGQLIGIVNAKSSGSDIEGLGFAIPVNDAMDVAEQLMQYGYVKGRPALGVSVVEINQDTNLWSIRSSQYAAILNYVTEYGVYFAEYQEGQSGDFRFGDRIVAINGVTVSAFADIRSVLSEYKVGDTVTVTVARIDDVSSRNPRSTMVDVSVTLVEKTAG